MHGQAGTPRDAAADGRAAARRRLDDIVAAFVRDAPAYRPADGRPPPALAVAAPPGLGKTEVALRAIAAVLPDLRAEGDRRTVAVACPTVAVAEQVAGRFAAMP